MKFIVIGLGYFGSKLAVNLTNQGHEVIGVDNRPDRIDELKDSISIVMEMDTTIESAVKSLPLDDTDAVIVGIGEDVGSSILTLSILMSLNVKRLIGRAITPRHENILMHIGIKEIVHPEEEAAFALSSMLRLKNALKITELDDDNMIVELYVPKKYVGHTLESINLLKRFNLRLLAVKVLPEKKHDLLNLKMKKIDYVADFDFNLQLSLKDDDVLVLAGNLKDIKQLSEE